MRDVSQRLMSLWFKVKLKITREKSEGSRLSEPVACGQDIRHSLFQLDVYKNIYTISLDTKVVSKIIELMIFPIIVKFAKENDYEMILTSHQNHYPDISFISKKTKEKIALDLKSTYRINSEKVNGMTLGAFTGYFRNRKSTKNITFP